jgi:hypothetical protein
MFGDDPFIVVPGGGRSEDAKFSAWDHANERCRVLCGEAGTDEVRKAKPAE